MTNNELTLDQLQQVSGGVAPIVLGGILAAVAYAAYKGYKEMDQVDQNVDFSSGSDDKNKLSYGGISQTHEDPFDGAFTGKAN
mgnify:CR=1 FL=1